VALVSAEDVVVAVEESESGGVRACVACACEYVVRVDACACACACVWVCGRNGGEGDR
jgi:hypothetical protein